MLTHLFAYLTDPLSELVLKASRKFLPNARPVGMIMPKRRRSQSAERDSIQQNKQPRLDEPRNFPTPVLKVKRTGSTVCI